FAAGGSDRDAVREEVDRSEAVATRVVDQGRGGRKVGRVRAAVAVGDEVVRTDGAVAVAPRAGLGAQDLHAGNVWHANRLAHLTVALRLDREGADGERDRLPTALGLDARRHEQRERGEGERANSSRTPVGRHGRPSGGRTLYRVTGGRQGFPV